MKEILVGDGENPTRIFRPSEFSSFMLGIPKLDNQIRVKASLYTGMRIVELRRFQYHDHRKKLGDNEAWYDIEKGFICLPKEASHKKLQTIKRRYVRLNQPGKEVIPQFLRLKRAFPGKLGDNATWNENLKRWAENVGLSTVGICPKMFRKTWESWLTFYYPDKTLVIFKSQGHTKTVALEHYVDLPFDTSDRLLMTPYVGGWI